MFSPPPLRLSLLLIVAAVTLVSCDSAAVVERAPESEVVSPIRAASPAFASLRARLDASLAPGTVDDAYVKLSDRFEGFGGLYEDEAGHLVLTFTDERKGRAVRDELVDVLLEMGLLHSKHDAKLLSKEVKIRQVTYSFTELAAYRALLAEKLQAEAPIVLTDADEERNVVRIGVDETADIAVFTLQSLTTRYGVPAEAAVFERVPTPEVAAPGPAHDVGLRPPGVGARAVRLTDHVRPLAGGLLIRANGGCSMGVPVWYGSSSNPQRGFLTASHCTSFVGYNNGSQWSQHTSGHSIGIEFEDPPLTNCDSTSLECLVDAALIDLNSAHDNSTQTLVPHVYLTSFSSSTGPGSYSLTGETVDLRFFPTPRAGMDVHKVGQRTGWTSGDITGTCVDGALRVRHPDGIERLTRTQCYIEASTPVNSGDSGSALITILDDPLSSQTEGGFLGILSYCTICNPNITSATSPGGYVSWAAINQAFTNNIRLFP